MMIKTCTIKVERLYFLFIIFLLITNCSNLYAQKQDGFFGDSALYVLSMSCYDSIKSPSFFEMQQRGLKEADAKQNDHFQYVFRVMVVSRYESLLDKANFRKEAYKLIEHYKKPLNETHLYSIWSLVIDRYNMWGDIAEAVAVNKEMSDYAQKHAHKKGILNANFNFAQSYLNNKQIPEAKKYYRKVLKESIIINDYGKAVRSAFNLVNILSGEGLYDQALALSDSIPVFISGWEASKGIAINPVFRLDQARYRLNLFCKTGDKVNAAIQRDSMLYYNNVYKDGAKQYSVFYSLVLYDELAGNYDSAISTLNQLINYQQSQRSYTNLADCRRRLAEIQRKKGDYGAATQSYYRYAIEKDSANIGESNAQLDRLTKTFRLKELEQEKLLSEQKHKNIVLMVWGIAGVAILIMIICVLLILNRRKLLQKNRELVDRIRREDANEQQIEDLKISQPQRVLNRDEELFEKIKELMKDKDVLIKEDLSRDILASLLNTNRTYIADAIRSCTSGSSVSEYINTSRCRYARRLIDLNPYERLDAIAYQAGFNTRSNFARIYKRVYGITPSEYREALR